MSHFLNHALLFCLYTLPSCRSLGGLPRCCCWSCGAARRCGRARPASSLRWQSRRQCRLASLRQGLWRGRAGQRLGAQWRRRQQRRQKLQRLRRGQQRRTLQHQPLLRVLA